MAAPRTFEVHLLIFLLRDGTPAKCPRLGAMLFFVRTPLFFFFNP